MAKRWDVVATVGTYTDRDGNEKRRYQNCGAVFEKDGKLSLKLEAIPVGDWNGWFNLYEPHTEARPAQERAPQAQGESDDDFSPDLEVPF